MLPVIDVGVLSTIILGATQFILVAVLAVIWLFMVASAECQRKEKRKCRK